MASLLLKCTRRSRHHAACLVLDIDRGFWHGPLVGAYISTNDVGCCLKHSLGRYQCDGFFQGGKPPWLDSAAAPQPMTESKAWDGTPVEPSAAWTPVWKAAWAGMAKTDPDAKWLYQGWCAFPAAHN